MKYIYLILAACCCLFPREKALAQPGIEWSYKNAGSTTGIPQSIVIAGNGDLVVAAANEGIKVFNATGKLLKTCPMGSTDIKRVLRNDDGTYYAIGDTIENVLYPTNGWVARLNDTLGILWQRSCGGFNSDRFNDAAITRDGGIIVAGRSNSASGDLAGAPNIFPGGWTYGWIMKLTAGGQPEWTKIYGYEPDVIGPGATQEIDRIVALKDGGYIFGGQMANGTGEAGPVHGSKDGWVVRIDDTGSIRWQKTYGGNILMALTGGALTDEGDFVATGIGMSLNGIPNTPVNGRFYGIVAQKFEGATGSVLWTKAIGTDVDFDGSDEPCTLWYGSHTAITKDGHIVIGAYLTASLSIMNIPAMDQAFKGKNDYWVLKLNAANGTLLWHKVFGGGNIDRAYALVPTPDGGLIAGGSSNSGNEDVNTPSPLPTGYGPWLVKLGPCPYLFFQADTVCSSRPYTFFGMTCDSTGTYTKHFKTSSGCDSAYTLQLFVSGQKPQLNADSNQISTGPAATYQWLKDDEPVPGANERGYTMTAAGAYRVVVTNDYGCTDTSDAYRYIPDTPDDSFALYPVPTPNRLFLRWGKMAAGADIVMYTAEGRILYRTHTTATFLELPVSALAAGVYAIKVSIEGERINRKFIKL